MSSPPADTPPATPNTLVLHRLLQEPPRSVCKVNGRVVPLRVLRSLGALLVDVNGQGAAQQLGDSAACVALLDARAGTTPLAAQFGAALVWARTAEGEAAKARAAAPGSPEEAAAMQVLVDDVAEVDPQPGEEASLKRTLKRLDASRAALDSCALAAQALDVGAHDALRTAARELKTVAMRLEQHSPPGTATGPPTAAGDAEEDEAVDVAAALESVDRALEQVAAATQAAASAGAACADAAAALQVSPGLRDEVSARLRALERLCRKHGARNADDVLESAAKAALALGNSSGAAGKAAAMAAAAAAACADMARLGLQLGVARRNAARQLQADVEAELAHLRMEGARLRVALEWHDVASSSGDGPSSAAVAVPDAETALGVDGSCLYEPTPSGFDTATLLLATAPGEPFRQLGAVASGGERARVMLALKAVAATSCAGAPAVSLFDEVDAGVGGSTGGAVGATLRRLASSPHRGGGGGGGEEDASASSGGLRQVLCVTHLPQVAAHAHAHLAVSKEAAPDGRFVSVTRHLHTRQARAQELGSLLGLTPQAGEQLLAMSDADAARQAPAGAREHAPA